QADRRVALAHEEAVPVRPRGLATADGHHVIVERGKDLGRREDGRIVPDLGDLDEADGLEPHEARLLAQAGDLRRARLVAVALSCRWRGSCWHAGRFLRRAAPTS